MSIEIKLPDIGLEAVEVIEIYVNINDIVQINSPLITVEGDKASMDIPSPMNGLVKKINISIGDKISTGTVIMLMSATEPSVHEDKNNSGDGKTFVQHNNANFYEKNVILPDIGDDIMEVTEILVKVGDEVFCEQSLITMEGNKASVDLPSPFSGKVKSIKVNIGDQIHTGSLIMVLEIKEIKKKILLQNSKEKKSKYIE